ncbi:phosphoketolase family protein [Streptomyces aurantiogriseus]
MSVDTQQASAPLTDDELRTLDAHWRAANYLSVGQIYLMANPLLTEPLRPEHVKPRLLGHWGTSPGLNLVHTHLNRVIKARGQDALCIWGPGHGGPAVLANAWLEGSYSETYPDVSRDAAGMERLFRQFSFPGGVPSHVAPETPGSIHEGGELGYSLSHAYGAALDNPDVLAAAQLLRTHLPELTVRVVNVVDIARLLPAEEHPHGMSDFEYDGLFTPDKPVIFAYHGYPWLIHRLAYRRTGHKNLHVRGYKEIGTTTTPFDMVVRNDLDRYRLVMDVIDRVPGLAVRAAAVRQQMEDARLRHHEWIRVHGTDLPEVADWSWDG